MIVREASRNVELSGVADVRRFGFDLTAKAVKQLTTGIYSDNVTAPIRELATNAADSHVMAGRPDEPFDVHLPNPLEPYFSVRDRGVGITPHQMDTVFTVFFRSDKTHSNELTGALGLGAKSPLAYTDLFTVVSVTGGVERTYSVYTDAEGIPALALRGEAPAAGPTGVEVSFAVAPPDFDAFAEKAARVLSVFAVRPRVTGRPDFKFDEPEYRFRGEAYGLRRRRDGSRLIMGNIAYGLDAINLGGLAGDACALLAHGLDLWVPLGTVDVAANRETVRYDDRGREAIREALAAVAADVRARAATAVAAAPTLWQARRLLCELRDGVFGTLKAAVNAAWQGRELDENARLPAGVLLTRYEPKSSYRRYRRNASTAPRKHEGTSYAVLPGLAEPVYHDDGCIRGRSRAIQEALTTDKPVYYLHGEADALREFLDESGAAEVSSPVSELPLPPAAPPGARRKVKKGQYFRYKESYYSRAAGDYWEAGDPPDDALCVPLRRYKPLINDREAGNGDLGRLLRTAREVGLLAEHAPVYGVRQCDVGHVGKDGLKFLHAELAARLTARAVKLRPAVHAEEALATHASDADLEALRNGPVKALYDRLRPRSVLRRYLAYLLELDERRAAGGVARAKFDNHVNQLRMLARELGVAWRDLVPDAPPRLAARAEELHARVKAQYPLLDAYEPAAWARPAQVEYIQLVDRYAGRLRRAAAASQEA